MALRRSDAAPERRGTLQSPEAVSRAEGEPRLAASGPGEASGERTEVAPSSGQRWVVLARLVRPHGRRGELIAEVLTDFPERFRERSHLFLMPPERLGTGGRAATLENFWFQRSRVIFKFEGVDSINDAEGLRGFSVVIPAHERAPLDAGSVYISDLIGCHVFDLNTHGAEIGEIVDVDRTTSSTDLLVIRRAGRSGSEAEALVPFVKQYLVRIDTQEQRLEMRLPEGLLEINAPMTEEEKLVMQRGREDSSARQ